MFKPCVRYLECFERDIIHFTICEEAVATLVAFFVFSASCTSNKHDKSFSDSSAKRARIRSQLRISKPIFAAEDVLN